MVMLVMMLQRSGSRKWQAIALRVAECSGTGGGEWHMVLVLMVVAVGCRWGWPAIDDAAAAAARAFSQSLVFLERFHELRGAENGRGIKGFIIIRYLFIFS